MVVANVLRSFGEGSTSFFRRYGMSLRQLTRSERLTFKLFGEFNKVREWMDDVCVALNGLEYFPLARGYFAFHCCFGLLFASS